MFLKTLLTAAAVAVAMPAFAEGTITVTEAYARAGSPMSKAGAAFMVISNSGAEDDRLIDASSEIAVKTELHTHIAGADGVMQMVHVPEGFVIPANGSHELARGGDHVMFMGLKQPMQQDDVVTVTLVFEKAGEMVIEVPVDLTRGQGTMMDQGGGMGHMHGAQMNGAAATN
ncbi:copper chaperone PCu(A)C [Ostreiculturibacter nitratireducens]|uniref:copper chaperone PCu(A)C n=1 Tax=Ostreiculturibacter nitratireducens TaxID=3075226 RepID=UPI0031B5BDF2